MRQGKKCHTDWKGRNKAISICRQDCLHRKLQEVSIYVLEVMNEFSKVTFYTRLVSKKINVFVYTNNKQLKIEFFKCTIYNSTEKQKYLGINLKNMWNIYLYSGNYRTLMKETKEYLNK